MEAPCTFFTPKNSMIKVRGASDFVTLRTIFVPEVLHFIPPGTTNVSNQFGAFDSKTIAYRSMRGVAGHRRPGARPRALPRLHAVSLTPSHTHSPRSRGLPHARMPAYASALGALAHIGKPRTEQLSIRVQATHRPGALPMPTKGKVSSATTKDSTKRSSAGASSSGSQRAAQSFRASAGSGGR